MKTSYIFLAVIGLFLRINTASAQGCIAVRHMSCAAPGASSAALFKQRQTSKWLLNIGYRHLHSYKHFVGDEEQTQRVEQGTQVINDQHGIDVGLSYQFTNRFNVAVNLPFSVNSRSSLYEHYGNTVATNPTMARFKTGTMGIGDLRISANYWLINPAKLKKYNVMLGAGLKLPTGNWGATDNFHKLTKDGADYTVNLPVDQSIQLGDGAVGFSLEGQAYYQLGRAMTLYANGFYLFNPAATNSTVRNPTATTIDLVTGKFSVADQFAARLGVNYALAFLPGLSIMGGGRVEGVPSTDAIGSSTGFRRPGYIVSVEPGVAYMNHKYSVAATVPLAVYRNRTKSYADKLDPLGLKHGDAAFADYFISLNVARSF